MLIGDSLSLRLLCLFCLLLHGIAHGCWIIFEVLGNDGFFSSFGNDAVLFFLDNFVKFPARDPVPDGCCVQSHY